MPDRNALGSTVADLGVWALWPPGALGQSCFGPAAEGSGPRLDAVTARDPEKVS